jgi:hypothetical protein
MSACFLARQKMLVTRAVVRSSDANQSMPSSLQTSNKRQRYATDRDNRHCTL